MPNSTKKLQDAIQKLEAFARQVHKQSVETPLKKAISLFKSLIEQSFFNKTFLKRSSATSQKNSESILEAVEVVNRERLLIQKLKSGSPTERSLADSFALSIENYNKTRESCENPPQDQKKQRLRSLFKKQTSHAFSYLPKIDLPQHSIVHYYFTGALAQKKQVECSKEKILSLSEIPIALPSILPQRSAELFQMKALALLERYGIASNPEARTEVKQSPIFTSYLPGSHQCTLSQTLALFPGQRILVKGSSEFDLTTKTIRKMFPETFSISFESSQTGFPHPLQRAAWSLANELLPHCPQRLDLLPSLKELYQAKQKAAIDLLPKGSRIGIAKKLLQLKRHVFNHHKTELVALHHQLALVIAEAAFGCHNFVSSIIDPFFEELSFHPAPYDRLAEASQHIQELFIAEPYHYLIETALKEERSESTPENYSLAKNALKKALFKAQTTVREFNYNATSISERRKWSFIELMGAAFGPSSQNIVLQYLSEDLVFRPPFLDSFARKTQAVAYKHTEDFLQELYDELPADSETEQNLIIYQRLKSQIIWDIDLFQKECQHPVVHELANYFEKRNQQINEK